MVHPHASLLSTSYNFFRNYFIEISSAAIVDKFSYQFDYLIIEIGNRIFCLYEYFPKLIRQSVIMDKIGRFFNWRPADRWLMIRVYFTLVTTSLLLKFIPLNHLRNTIASHSKLNGAAEDPLVVHRIVEALETASQHMPGKTTCLVKALSGYRLLTQSNIPVEMCIGVKLGLPGQVGAHAWIVYREEVILGNIEDLPSYTKLTSPKINIS